MKSEVIEQLIDKEETISSDIFLKTESLLALTFGTLFLSHSSSSS